MHAGGGFQCRETRFEFDLVGDADACFRETGDRLGL
jgi:hypothetical protein